MNLKEEILTTLALHPEWDLFTMVRWIYLKTCIIFSYDWQYFYVSKEEKMRIYQSKLNIEQINKADIICSTWCHLFIELLSLIGVEAWIKTDPNLHCYVLFKLNDVIYKADATKGYDFSRVKIGCSTNGFYPITSDFSFKQCLTLADTIIGYKEKIYADEAIKHINEDFRKENYIHNQNFLEPFDYSQLYYKISLIQTLINSTKKIKRFHDTDFYLSYLGRNLFTAYERSEVLIQTFYRVKDNPDIIDFFLVRDDSKKLICVLKNLGGKFSLLEATNEEIDYYVSCFEGKYEQLILQYKK